MAGYRVTSFITRSDDEIYAHYKGCDIDIQREEEPVDGATFTIFVNDPNGGYLYDGCWGDEANTMDEALEEALLGSQLIMADQRKFNSAGK